jgi:hypothetical protein
MANDNQHNNIQHYGIQHNSIQHNDIQHYDMQQYDIQHNDIQHDSKYKCSTQHSVSFDMQSVANKSLYAECRGAVCMSLLSVLVFPSFCPPACPW